MNESMEGGQMNAGVGVLSALALAIGAALWTKRDAPRTATALFLVAGIGVGGALGNALSGGLNRAFGANLGASESRVGLAVFVVIVGASAYAAYEVSVKGIGWDKHKVNPRRWHPWAALVLPTVAIAVGVPFLAQVAAMFSGGADHAGAALMNLGQR
jgi:dipeptide/tripeptide permease